MTYCGDTRPIVRLLWLAPVALAAQIIVIGFVDDPLIRLLLPASQLLLAPFLLANWSYRGVRLVLLGLLMNLLAMCLNGGLMPISSATVDAVGRQDSADLTVGEHVPGSKNILLRPEDTHLRALGDTIVVPGPKPISHAISLGDLVVGIGAMLATGEVLRRASASLKRELNTRESALVA